MTAQEAPAGAAESPAPPRRRRSVWRWLRWVLLAVVALVLLVVVGVAAYLLHYNVPSNAAGMAAETVCSTAFMGGRPADADTLMQQDVLPASSVLKVVSTSIDTTNHTVTAKFLGLFPRTASLITDRGCVLDGPPDPSATPYVAPSPRPAPWPQGDATAPQQQWPNGVDATKLEAVVDAAMKGSGDPTAANARGVAVVQDGKLLIERDGKDIAPNVALHGWSMSKTVSAMLAWKRFNQVGLDVNTPVVDAFPPGKEPSWVGEWKSDERAKITINDLLHMRAGLDIDESYDPFGSVVQMLYGENNMGSWAADHPADHPAGSYWEYLTAVSNILSQVVRAQFPNDQAYWQYPKQALFGPIGADSAQLATDESGNWVGGAYVWSSTRDWAKLGELMLQDGQWQGRQVLPKGWWKLAGTPATPDGDGHGYGAQTWIAWQPKGGWCANTPGVPKHTLTMEGHWGQVVAMVPSRNAVIVRMGWTFDESQFDECRFIADVVSTLPKQ